MRIRQLTAADDAGRMWKKKIARGLCAVNVDPGEMPELPAWFSYTIGTFDRKRVYLSATPTGARRGYKTAARDLLLKAQADHVWPTLPTPAEARKRANEAKANAAATRRQIEAESAAEGARVRERNRAEAITGPALVRRFDAAASHPLTYTSRAGAVAWLRRTQFGGRKGFRMMIAQAVGGAAHGEGPTMIEDLSDAANQLDAIVAARFGDNWTPAE